MRPSVFDRRGFGRLGLKVDSLHESWQIVLREKGNRKVRKGEERRDILNGENFQWNYLLGSAKESITDSTSECRLTR